MQSKSVKLPESTESIETMEDGGIIDHVNKWKSKPVTEPEHKAAMLPEQIESKTVTDTKSRLHWEQLEPEVTANTETPFTIPKRPFENKKRVSSIISLGKYVIENENEIQAELEDTKPTTSKPPDKHDRRKSVLFDHEINQSEGQDDTMKSHHIHSFSSLTISNDDHNSPSIKIEKPILSSLQKAKDVFIYDENDQSYDSDIHAKTELNPFLITSEQHLNTKTESTDDEISTPVDKFVKLLNDRDKTIKTNLDEKSQKIETSLTRSEEYQKPTQEEKKSQYVSQLNTLYKTDGPLTQAEKNLARALSSDERAYDSPDTVIIQANERTTAANEVNQIVEMERTNSETDIGEQQDPPSTKKLAYAPTTAATKSNLVPLVEHASMYKLQETDLDDYNHFHEENVIDALLTLPTITQDDSDLDHPKTIFISQYNDQTTRDSVIPSSSDLNSAEENSSKMLYRMQSLARDSSDMNKKSQPEKDLDEHELLKSKDVTRELMKIDLTGTSALKSLEQTILNVVHQDLNQQISGLNNDESSESTRKRPDIENESLTTNTAHKKRSYITNETLKSMVKEYSTLPMTADNQSQQPSKSSRSIKRFSSGFLMEKKSRTTSALKLYFAKQTDKKYVLVTNSTEMTPGTPTMISATMRGPLKLSLATEKKSKEIIDTTTMIPSSNSNMTFLCCGELTEIRKAFDNLLITPHMVFLTTENKPIVARAREYKRKSQSAFILAEVSERKQSLEQQKKQEPGTETNVYQSSPKHEQRIIGESAKLSVDSQLTDDMAEKLIEKNDKQKPSITTVNDTDRQEYHEKTKEENRSSIDERKSAQTLHIDEKDVINENRDKNKQSVKNLSSEDDENEQAVLADLKKMREQNENRESKLEHKRPIDDRNREPIFYSKEGTTEKLQNPSKQIPVDDVYWETKMKNKLSTKITYHDREDSATKRANMHSIREEQTTEISEPENSVGTLISKQKFDQSDDTESRAQFLTESNANIVKKDDHQSSKISLNVNRSPMKSETISSKEESYDDYFKIGMRKPSSRSLSVSEDIETQKNDPLALDKSEAARKVAFQKNQSDVELNQPASLSVTYKEIKRIEKDVLIGTKVERKKDSTTEDYHLERLATLDMLPATTPRKTRDKDDFSNLTVTTRSSSKVSVEVQKSELELMSDFISMRVSQSQFRFDPSSKSSLSSSIISLGTQTKGEKESVYSSLQINSLEIEKSDSTQTHEKTIMEKDKNLTSTSRLSLGKIEKNDTESSKTALVQTGTTVVFPVYPTELIHQRSKEKNGDLPDVVEQTRGETNLITTRISKNREALKTIEKITPIELIDAFVLEPIKMTEEEYIADNIEKLQDLFNSNTYDDKRKKDDTKTYPKISHKVIASDFNALPSVDVYTKKSRLITDKSIKSEQQFLEAKNMPKLFSVHNALYKQSKRFPSKEKKETSLKLPAVLSNTEQDLSFDTVIDSFDDLKNHQERAKETSLEIIPYGQMQQISGVSDTLRSLWMHLNDGEMLLMAEKNSQWPNKYKYAHHLKYESKTQRKHVLSITNVGKDIISSQKSKNLSQKLPYMYGKICEKQRLVEAKVYDHRNRGHQKHFIHLP
ncbi:unnamed protein product, partial [Didymodactylos carnosus]